MPAPARHTVTITPMPSSREIGIRAPYDAELNQRIKEIPGRRWDRALRSWVIPDSPSARNALEKAFGIHLGRSDTLADDQSTASGPFNGHLLLGRFEDELRLRAYSPRTRKGYLRHARDFLAARRSDESRELAEELRRYVLERTRDGKISRSYHDQLVSALRLFCATVLKRNVEDLPLTRPRREQRLPVVLSPAEVLRLLEVIRNPKHIAVVALVYSAGLRVSEVVRLKPDDLDRDRGVIHVREGKGRKDRFTLLADAARQAVDRYLDGVEPGTWLFPGSRPSRHLCARTVQKIVEQARIRARIGKRVSVHTLRHSFATHLLEAGTDLRYIQELLGHRNPRTTQIYAHVSTRSLARIRSPLDELRLGPTASRDAD